MTEAEWRECDDPRRLLLHLGTVLQLAPREEPWPTQIWQWVRGSGRRSPVQDAARRKLVLFAAACCVRSTRSMILGDFWDRELQALVAVGRGQKPVESFGRDWAHVDAESWAVYRASCAIRHMGIHELGAPGIDGSGAAAAPVGEPTIEEYAANWNMESAIQSLMLRDIFGNPFRPATFDPAWRTATVTSLAQGIYDERRFTDLPILADALEDAGCASADMLGHCRTPADHVLGCWVVDLALAKG